MDLDKSQLTVDLSDKLAIIWKHKWLVIIPLVLVSAIVFVGSSFMEPVYQSSVTISLGNPFRLSSEVRQLVGNAGDVLTDDQNRAYQLKSLQNEITSSPYLQQLIERLKLDRAPALDQQVQKMREIRPELTPQEARLQLLANSLRDRITIAYAGLDQVKISVESNSPTGARDLAQNLGEILMEEKTRQELGSVRLSQDFTSEQLAKYEKDLQDKIDARTELEKTYAGFSPGDVTVADSNREAISQELDAANSDLENKKNEEIQLVDRLSNIPSGSLVLKVSPEHSRLQDEVNNLLGTMTTLIPRYKWSSPEILNFKSRLYDYTTSLENENERLVNAQFSGYDTITRDNVLRLFNLRLEMDLLYTKVNNLKLIIAKLNEKISSYPEYQTRLDQLNREIEAARDLRDRFKDQQESSQISQAFLRESRFRVVEPARTPLVPVRPDRPRIMILGVALGLMIGLVAVIITELLDTSFKNLNEVENYLGYPVLGVIPEISSMKKKAV